MHPVHLGQQSDIDGAVLGGETSSEPGPPGDLSVLSVLPDQARDLSQAQAAHLGQQRAHQSLLSAAPAGILLRHQRLLNPFVSLALVVALKGHFPAAFQKLPYLIRIPISWVLHLNLHPPGVCWFSGSSCIGNRSAVQDHSVLDNSVLSVSHWRVVQCVALWKVRRQPHHTRRTPTRALATFKPFWMSMPA